MPFSNQGIIQNRKVPQAEPYYSTVYIAAIAVVDIHKSSKSIVGSLKTWGLNVPFLYV
jgi:hypothetical protein